MIVAYGAVIALHVQMNVAFQMVITLRVLTVRGHLMAMHLLVAPVNAITQ